MPVSLIQVALNAADASPAHTTAGKIAAFLDALPTKFAVEDVTGVSRLYVTDFGPLAHALRNANNPNYGGNAPNNTPGGTPVSGGNRAPEYVEYERRAA